MSQLPKLNSFRSVKNQNRAFETFQNSFLSRVGEPSPPRTFKEKMCPIYENNLEPSDDESRRKVSSNKVFSSNPLDNFTNKFVSHLDKSPNSLILNAQKFTSENQNYSLNEKMDDEITLERKKQDESSALSPEIDKYFQNKGVNNNDLLEIHMNKDSSTVMPFVKKFVNKLKNSSYFRNVQQLKAHNFKLLSDSAYFFQDDEKKKDKDIYKVRGLRKISLSLKSFYEHQIYKLKKNEIVKIVRRFVSEREIMVIHPYQNIKILWDLFHWMLILFWLFYIPILMAFEEVQGLDQSSNFYMTIFLLIDIFLNFNTSYFKNGVVENGHPQIFIHYLKSRFFLDLIPLFPLIIDVIFDNYWGDYKNYLPIHMLNFLFYIKISTLREIYNRMNEKFLLKEKFQNILSLFKVLFVSILVAHLFACFWYFSSKESNCKTTWISKADLLQSPWQIKYLYSMYWACVTMMTVGYGDIVPQNEVEIIVCMISVVLGCAVYAYNISSIGMILQDLNKENVEFEHNINIINQFMNRKRINQDLQMRIREYLKFIWQEENTQNLEDEQKIISLLSSSLKEELLIEAYGSILKKFPMFFANFTEKSLRKVVGIINDIKLFPEECIFSENDEDDLAIYFIMKGKVELCTKSGIMVKELGIGEHFGEIGFFSGKARSLSVKSKDFTTLFSINRKKFIEVLMKNSDDFEKLCMIQDQIVFYDNYFPLKVRCFSCNQIGHTAHQCNLIHFIPDKEKVIKKHNYYLDQERTVNFKRKMRKQKALQKKCHLEKASKKIVQITQNERIALMKLIDDDDQSIFSSEDSLGDQEASDAEPRDGSITFEETSIINKESPSKSKSLPVNENLPIDKKKSTNTIQNDSDDPFNNSMNDPKISSKVIEIPAGNNSPLRQTETIISGNLQVFLPSGEELNSNNNIKVPNFREDLKSAEGSLLKIPEYNIKRKLNPTFIKDLEKNEENYQHQRSDGTHFKNKKNCETLIKTHTSSTKKTMLYQQKDLRDNENSSNFDTFEKFLISNPLEEIIRINNNPRIRENNEKKATILYNLKRSMKPFSNFSINSSRHDHSQSSQGTRDQKDFPKNFIERIMDNFDRVASFKNYFPENNSKAIFHSINNKKNYRFSRVLNKEKTVNLEKRLAKYTFFPEEMKQRMPGTIKQRMRMASSDKKRHGFSEDNPINEKSIGKKTGSKIMKIKQKKRYFTGGLFETKFSDVVKMIMRSPMLKNKLKKNNNTLN